jgi:hypothetical protein
MEWLNHISRHFLDIVRLPICFILMGLFDRVAEPEPKLLAGAGAGAGIKFRLRLRLQVRQSPKGYLYSTAVVGKLLLKSS